MDAESERKLKEHLERSLGRPVTDDEWAALLRAGGERGEQTGARSGRSVRSFVGGALRVVGLLLVMILVGAVVYGLLLGLLWAYNPSGLEDEELGLGGLVVAAWFTGFLVVGAWQAFPTATAIVLGLGLGLGGVALAIGALLEAAG
jgi:ABC-type dipeptide/oligopeptide/nickel transport system permease component